MSPEEFEAIVRLAILQYVQSRVDDFDSDGKAGVTIEPGESGLLVRYGEDRFQVSISREARDRAEAIRLLKREIHLATGKQYDIRLAALDYPSLMELLHLVRDLAPPG